MRITITLAFLAIVYSTTADAQGNDAERQVIAASEARLAAVLHADADVLNRIQDDDFVLTQDGLILDKDEQIARVLAFDAPAGSPSHILALHSISFEGNVAIMTGVVTITLNDDAFRSAFTEVWLRRRGNWVAKAAHYSTIIPPQIE